MDKSTKYGHFLSLSHPYSATMVAQQFVDLVYKFHGLPDTISIIEILFS